jgi:hypothetical protein
MELPARRRTALALVAGVVAATALGGAALAWQLGGDDEDPPAVTEEYDAARVPWWDGRTVHWAGHAVPEDDVASYTATGDAAVFLHDRPQYPEQPGPQGLGTLTALFDDGSMEELATRVVGVPMADPAGRVVAWTVQVDPDTALLSAYDTAERVGLGSHRIEVDDEFVNFVTAVVGDRVFAASADQVLLWEPLEGGSAPQVVPGLGRDVGAVVGGTDDGLLVAGESFELSWIGTDGSRRRVETSFGDLSPDGRYLVTGTDDETDEDDIVVSLTSGERVDVDLPADRTIYQARWTADGTLVAATVSADELEEGWDDALDVTSYACDLDAGTCRQLTGGPAYVGALALFEDNFLGQFLIAWEGSGLS